MTLCVRDSKKSAGFIPIFGGASAAPRRLESVSSRAMSLKTAQVATSTLQQTGSNATFTIDRIATIARSGACVTQPLS